MRNSIYTFDNDTYSFYPFIRQFSNYQGIRNAITIEDPSSVTSYAWANYPSFQEYLHDYSMNGCWVFNKEKRTYHWDSTVRAKADKLTKPYEYVGPSINDVDIHYDTNFKGLSLIKKPVFGDELHAPWPGEFMQDDEDGYDRWANSDGMVSKFLYNTVNEFYITFQALNPFKKNEEIRSVAGYGVNRNEIVDAGAVTIGSLAPIGGGIGKGTSYAKSLRYEYKPFKRDNGALNFSLKVLNTKTLKQVRLERHNFNNKVGTKVHTIHLNYGTNGEWHFFFNFSKARKIKLPKKTAFKNYLERKK